MRSSSLITTLIILTLLAACNGVFEVGIEHPDKGIATRIAATNEKLVLTMVSGTLTAKIPQINTLPLKTRTKKATPTLITPLIPRSIYFTLGDFLYRMDLNGRNREKVTDGAGLSEMLAVDTAHKRIYTSRWGYQAQILEFDVKTPGYFKVFSDGPGDGGGQGIAIDPFTSKMYVGLYYSGVFVKDMNDGSHWVQLVTASSLSPLIGQRGQLQIDPVNRQVYFRTAYNGDCGLCRYIYRVDFDGGNLTRIIQANGGDALALDLYGGKMYFSDEPGNYTVKRANLDGTMVETVMSISAPYRFCKFIVLNNGDAKMYLSLVSDVEGGYRGRAIARANMDGTRFEILYEGYGDDPEDVAGGIALLP